MSSAESSATIHLGRSRVPWSRSRQVLSKIMRKFIRRLKRMVKCVQKGNPPRNLGGYIDVGVTYFHGQSPGNYRRRS